MSIKLVALLACISALAVAPCPAFAELLLVGENAEGDRFHVDSETVTELTEDVVVFDTIVNHRQPQANGTTVTVDRFVADCRTNSVANVSWLSLDANQRPVVSQALPPLEANVAPAGSLMMAEIELACTAID
ncbi:hypothetical protein IQ268_20885 [Oculatella sp. LEGE 06141]|uniref:hypothetical protein n=1 Tax=Oculatella sp. LEGE 06141 TaxID=1828648 RepID=UPI00187F3605|nr:hypothetical protein [Oculatella sp. LEGE 06141]MBE9181019.1 hypothetical protein [Oculatella sp. LEGE 06141]